MRGRYLVVVFAVFSLWPSLAYGQAEFRCDQISTQELAQWIFDRNPSAYPALDEDGDGIACEELPRGGPIGGPSIQPTATDQLAPTATMVPVAPTPTATVPPPPPTPSRDLTDQEVAYFAALMAELQHAQEIGSGLSDLFGQAGNDTTLLVDDAWRLDMVAHLVEWQQFHVDAQGMNPSPRQQHIHDLWLKTTELMSLSADDFIAGLDNLDAAAIERGGARIVYATLLIEDATAATEAFYVDPNAPFDPTHAVSPVPSCDPFPTYEEAQQYYAAYPAEQPVIDPDFDGLACEVHFGRG